MDKAQRIIPVYLRVRGLNRPVSGIMLCDYSTKNFSLRAGQHVYVLDNAYVALTNTSSEEEDASEASECSTCSYCCGHRPGCENCGLPLSSTTTETTQTEGEGSDSVIVTPGDPVGASEATGSTSSANEESTVTSSPGCSHTFCSQREPVMWKVRTADGSLTADVPAVTVMINEHDDEAISHAYE